MAGFTYCKDGVRCSICGASKNCRRTDTMHFCRYRRSEHDFVSGYAFVGESGGGTEDVFGMWVHENDLDRDHERIRIDRRHFCSGAARAPAADDQEAIAAFEQRRQRFEGVRDNMVPTEGPSLALYVQQTGLPADVLSQFSLSTWKDRYGRECWVTPEIGADGSIVAWSLRYPDRINYRGEMVRKGAKLSYGRPDASPARGLTIPAGLEEASGPVWMVEGPTDTMALTAMGFPAIGRPNNQGGAEAAAALLGRLGGDRGAVVVGENDRKEDGTWPGREGPLRFAAKLAALTGQTVRVVFPPEGCKDSREWFRKHNDGTPRYQLGNRFEAACLAGEVIEIAPTAPEAIAAVARYDAEQAQRLRNERDADIALDRMAHPLDRDDWQTIIPATPSPSPIDVAEHFRHNYHDHVQYPCDHPAPHLLEHLATGNPMYIIKRCGRCPHCLQRRIDNIVLRVRSQLEALDRDGIHYYECYCPVERWETLLRRMRRMAGDGLRYHRLITPQGVYIVTNANVGSPVNCQGVLTELRAALGEHFHGPRIFFSCRQWEEINLDRDRKKTCRYIAPVDPIPLQTLHDIAATVGARMETVVEPGGPHGDIQAMQIFKKAGGWDSDSLSYIHAMLRAGETLPRLCALDYDPDNHSRDGNCQGVHSTVKTSQIFFGDSP